MSDLDQKDGFFSRVELQQLPDEEIVDNYRVFHHVLGRRNLLNTEHQMRKTACSFIFFM